MRRRRRSDRGLPKSSRRPEVRDVERWNHRESVVQALEDEVADQEATIRAPAEIEVKTQPARRLWVRIFDSATVTMRAAARVPCEIIATGRSVKKPAMKM